MIHRAGFGSIERFIGILIEHYAGKFPVWLAPLQVKVIPVAGRHLEYANEVARQLNQAGLRAQADERNEKLGYKIRGAQLEKVPYMLILGDKEVEAQSISIRNRAGEETNDVVLQDFIADLQKAVRERQG